MGSSSGAGSQEAGAGSLLLLQEVLWSGASYSLINNGMLYYFKKGKNAEMQKKICAVYEEGAVIDRMCQIWFAKFLILLMFWPNNSLLWGCPTCWKMFSSTPGLYPLEANSGR